MIKLIGGADESVVGSTNKKYRGILEADTKDEVVAIGTGGSTVKGMKAGDVLTMGSMAITKSFEVGMLGSDGAWNFPEN